MIEPIDREAIDNELSEDSQKMDDTAGHGLKDMKVKDLGKKGYEKYIRYNAFPSTWCPGCGDGVVLKAIAMALDEMGMDPNDVAVVSGIGCSGRMSTFFRTNTLHTTHGRALTFATGVKLSKPDKLVIVISGDGDASAIGGNHLIHAARRNIGVKLVVINNGIYGMTGGQVSPTSSPGFYTETTPYGNFEPSFDLADLLKGARASFVARESVAHQLKLKQLLKASFEHKGFSAVEVLCNCHINLGRRNKMKTPMEMARYIDSITYPLEKAETLSAEEKAGKFPLGILANETNRLEYSDMYYNQLVPAARSSITGGGSL